MWNNNRSLSLGTLLFGVAALLSVVLAMIGFSQCYRAAGETADFLDLLYKALQLFVLYLDVVRRPLPITLQLARFLAPIISASSLLIAAWFVLHGQGKRLRLKLLKQHVVVCGLGRKGLHFVESIHRQGIPVCVVEKDSDNDNLVFCQVRNIPVIIGDATDPLLMRQIRVSRARAIIAVAEEDSTNVDIARVVNSMLLNRVPKGSPIGCFVHIGDPQLFAELSQTRPPNTNGRFTTNYFNVYEMGAKLLLEHCRKLLGNLTGEKTSLDIVVCGVGHLGDRLLEALNRERHQVVAAGVSTNVYVVDLGTRGIESRVRTSPAADYRSASKTKLIPIEVDVRSYEFDTLPVWKDLAGLPALVYVCFDNDSRAISTALRLRRLLAGSYKARIIVRLGEEAGLSELARTASSADSLAPVIEPFDFLKEVCRYELLMLTRENILPQRLGSVERKKGGGSDLQQNGT